MSEFVTSSEIRERGMARLTEELVVMLRDRVESRYYDQPHVIEIIARALLHSRGIYSQ